MTATAEPRPAGSARPGGSAGDTGSTSTPRAAGPTGSAGPAGAAGPAGSASTPSSGSRDARTSRATRPTARGWATGATAAVLLGFGWWASYPGVVGLGLALAVLLACAGVGLAVPAPVTVRRTARPPRVARLDDCVATVEVANASGWLAVHARGLDLVDGEATEFPLPRLAPGERVSADVPIPTHRRGVIEFGPLILFRSSLADLLRARRSYGTYTSVLVEPRVLDAVGLPAGARRGHVGSDERIAHGGTDLVGMREYTPGDDLRRVHWSTSARRGTLMVREDADPSAPHLTVLLDDRADSYDGDDFEEAVDVAASLLATAASVASPGRVRSLSGAVDEQSPVSAVSAGLDPAILGALAEVTTVTGPVPPAHRALVGAPDVLAIITGRHADLADLLLDAVAAPAGIVLVVDTAPDAMVAARQGVTVLRGPRAEDLVHGWRTVVAA
ncbi:DUF58 domain-containing protein [Georgenia sunbinii]|uniref:DUF58 domain-containing protein n=1 Tax=Georgenia sunbinii TaxID=3117728 RepID=UPI002F265BD0